VAAPRDGVVRAAIAAALLAERDRSAPRRIEGDARAENRATPARSAWLQAARLGALR
jgi:hypothetical protein